MRQQCERRARPRSATPGAKGEPVSSAFFASASSALRMLICGEPLVALPVAPQREQRCGPAHGCQHPVELLLAVRMPVREQCEIADRERRLGSRQCVEADLGVGEHLRAVALRDGAMFVGALGILAALEPPRAGCADLVLGLEADALCFVAAVVDARFDAERLQPVVDMGRPVLAPVLQQRGCVPIALLWRRSRSAPTSRMVSMTWACGFACPSLPMSQCTLRSATMPRATNSFATNSRASATPCSRGIAYSTSRASWASFLFSFASTSFHNTCRSRSCSGAPSGSITSEWTTPVLFEKS